MGRPIYHGMEHDKRLDNVEPANHRMHADSSEILVPKGKSLTKPLQSEHVGATTIMHAEIQKGYFQPPEVDFLNTNGYQKYFDFYNLSISRNGEDLPAENPDIDYVEDLGLSTLRVKYFINVYYEFDNAKRYDGIAQGITDFYYDSENAAWYTEELYFPYVGNNCVTGSFCLSTSPGLLYPGEIYQLESVLSENLTIYMCAMNFCVHSGTSSREMIWRNYELSQYVSFEPDIITVLRGGN